MPNGKEYNSKATVALNLIELLELEKSTGVSNPSNTLINRVMNRFDEHETSVAETILIMSLQNILSLRREFLDSKFEPAFQNDNDLALILLLTYFSPASWYVDIAPWSASFSEIKRKLFNIHYATVHTHGYRLNSQDVFGEAAEKLDKVIAALRELDNNDKVLVRKLISKLSAICQFLRNFNEISLDEAAAILNDALFEASRFANELTKPKSRKLLLVAVTALLGINAGITEIREGRDNVQFIQEVVEIISTQSKENFEIGYHEPLALPAPDACDNSSVPENVK